MRYLILSDIHANREALEAVIAHAAGTFDQILCCGDVVGYGADPNAAVEWTRAHVAVIVRGNHDKACAGLQDLEWFNPMARDSAEWTLAALSDQNREYLRGLPSGPLAVDSFDMLHGSPRDEDEYLTSRYEVAEAAPFLRAPVSFFGHTHLQGGFLLHAGGITALPRPKRGVERLPFFLSPDHTYLINVGSVGQPRDGDPRAAYVIWESESRTVTYSRVAYDVRAAQEKILAAGLPSKLAERLAAGR